MTDRMAIDQQDQEKLIKAYRALRTAYPILKKMGRTDELAKVEAAGETMAQFVETGTRMDHGASNQERNKQAR
jgi:hypothetical protein